MELYDRLRKLHMVPEGDIPEPMLASFCRSMGQWIIDECVSLWQEPAFDEERIAEDFGFVIATRVATLTEIAQSNRVTSPIEQSLLGALLWQHMGYGFFPLIDAPYPVTADAALPDCICIEPQAQIGKYRVDFLIRVMLYGKESARLAIECDGHDFHEKTKEQVARDKKRDREILAAGCVSLRFSGSEIFKSPHGCAQEVSDLVSNLIDKGARLRSLERAV